LARGGLGVASLSSAWISRKKRPIRSFPIVTFYSRPEKPRKRLFAVELKMPLNRAY